MAKEPFPEIGKIKFDGKDRTTVGEPKQTSGKQELYETIVAMYS